MVYVIDANTLYIVDCGTQPDSVGDVARTGLEARGRVMISRLLEGHILDHVAAALPGRHDIEQLGFAEQRADACRTEHLDHRKQTSHSQVVARSRRLAQRFLITQQRR